MLVVKDIISVMGIIIINIIQDGKYYYVPVERVYTKHYNVYFIRC